MPEQIAILGSGNLAYHLLSGLSFIGQPAKYLFSRNRNKGLSFTDEVSPKTVVVKDTDLEYYDFTFLILCVNDTQIESILHKIILPDNCIAVHTSGSIGIDVFPNHLKHVGVLYPFQTFTKKRKLDINQVPFFIEGANAEVQNRIFMVAKTLSNNVKVLDSTSRAKLHLTGVFINNFTNHLVKEAFRLVDENDLDKNDLVPLLNETIAKAYDVNIDDSQTGPAIRRDQSVIAKHLDMLTDNPDLKELYSLFTKLIQNKKK